MIADARSGFGRAATAAVIVARGRKQTGAEIVLVPRAKVSGVVQRSDNTPVGGASVLAQRYARRSAESSAGTPSLPASAKA